MTQSFAVIIVDPTPLHGTDMIRNRKFTFHSAITFTDPFMLWLIPTDPRGQGLGSGIRVRVKGLGSGLRVRVRG